MKNNNLKQFLLKFFLIFTLILSANTVYSAESDILREIKTLREDMNNRFEAMQSQMDKRFEQVDKRFDQLLWFIGLWIPLSMAVVGYILQKLNKHDDRFFEISKKSIEAEDIITAINKAKPETRKRLKEALKG
jgi:hypothetical protein